MDLVVALVADPEPPEVVEVSEAALDYPAVTAQPRAVDGAAAGDHGLDASGPQKPPVLVMVIATIGQDEVRFLSGPPTFAGDRPSREIVQQWDQLGDVVALPAGQRDR